MSEYMLFDYEVSADPIKIYRNVPFQILQDSAIAVA